MGGSSKHRLGCFSLLDDSDDGFVREENYGRVGYNSYQVWAHSSIETPETFLHPHYPQCLQEIVVTSLRSPDVLPESSSANLCGGGKERGKEGESARKSQNAAQSRVFLNMTEHPKNTPTITTTCTLVYRRQGKAKV